MTNTRPEIMPADVRRVHKQFDRWRAGKRARERIPIRLWEAAANLCEAHSIHQVSRWLRLNYAALKDQTGRPSRRRIKPAFVEWRLPVGSLPGASPAEYVVEVACRGEDTQRIHVRGASVSEVAALARALRADASGVRSP